MESFSFWVSEDEESSNELEDGLVDKFVESSDDKRYSHENSTLLTEGRFTTLSAGFQHRVVQFSTTMTQNNM
jgi:hypothetical protein